MVFVYKKLAQFAVRCALPPRRSESPLCATDNKPSCVLHLLGWFIGSRGFSSLERKPEFWVLHLERLRAGGEGDNRGWDGGMTSSIWWTWVWANPSSWWWTGRPGVLQSMGWQSVGRDWAPEQQLASTHGMPVASIPPFGQLKIFPGVCRGRGWSDKCQLMTTALQVWVIFLNYMTEHSSKNIHFFFYWSIIDLQWCTDGQEVHEKMLNINY